MCHSEDRPKFKLLCDRREDAGHGGRKPQTARWNVGALGGSFGATRLTGPIRYTLPTPMQVALTVTTILHPSKTITEMLGSMSLGIRTRSNWPLAAGHQPVALETKVRRIGCELGDSCIHPPLQLNLSTRARILQSQDIQRANVYLHRNNLQRVIRKMKACCRPIERIVQLLFKKNPGHGIAGQCGVALGNKFDSSRPGRP